MSAQSEAVKTDATDLYKDLIQGSIQYRTTGNENGAVLCAAWTSLSTKWRVALPRNIPLSVMGVPGHLASSRLIYISQLVLSKGSKKIDYMDGAWRTFASNLVCEA